jgi:hypothetical protein
VTDEQKQKLDKFIEAASKPGARLLVAPDVAEALEAWRTTDLKADVLLGCLAFTVDPYLRPGAIATVPRCRCGYEPCQPWRHAGWVS